MDKQVFFEDVIEGQEIPSLEKQVSTVNILMYLSTVWLIDRIHFDYPFATKRRGLPDVVAPGNMAGDYYSQLLSDWSGERGKLCKLSMQFRNFMVPGDILTCGGKIIGKSVKEGIGYVELDLWMKNQKNINCVPGRGIVQLPVKANTL